MAILPKSSSAHVTLTSWLQAAQEKVGPFLNQTKTLTMQTIYTSKAILDRYPPIKALVYSFGLFSLIPVLCFLGFAFTCGAVVLSVAGSTAAVVQGSLLAFGGFWLSVWICGAAIGSAIVCFWFAAAFFGLKTAKKLSA